MNNDPLKNSFKAGFKFAAGVYLAQLVMGLGFLIVIGSFLALICK